jgi:hypothetical protein
MVVRSVATVMFPLVIGAYIPLCAPVIMEPTMPASEAQAGELWEDPKDLADRDLFNGPWGVAYAPDPHEAYVRRPKKTESIPAWSCGTPRGANGT